MGPAGSHPFVVYHRHGRSFNLYLQNGLSVFRVALPWDKGSQFAYLSDDSSFVTV
jgi:hypothetical protein